MDNALYSNGLVFSVLGNLANNPQLFHEQADVLKDDLFINDFHKVVFNALQNMAYNADNASEINVLDIDTYLKEYPTYYRAWNENNGVDFLTDAKNNANSSLFNSGVDTLNKYLLLRTYDSTGIDIRDLYRFDGSDEERNEDVERLRNLSTSDIMEHYTQKVIDVRENFDSGDDEIVKFNLKDDIDSLVGRLSEEPEMGLPFSSSYYNWLFRGMRGGKYMLRSAESGSGKSVALDTLIPTPSGDFVKANDIKVGDKLFDRTGKPTTVLAKYMQPKHMLYKVTTSDGREQILHPNHLMSVYVGEHTNNPDELVTMPLEAVLSKFINTHFHVPLTKGVEYAYNPKLTHSDVFDMTIEQLEGVLEFTPETIINLPSKIREDVMYIVSDNGEGWFDSERLTKNYALLLDSLGIYREIQTNGDGSGAEVFTVVPDFSRYSTEIVSIEKYGEAESVCFTVDNPEHLFLINDYIVTHNTRQAMKDMLYISATERYIPGHGVWQDLGPAVPTLIISTELNKTELQMIALAYLTGITTSRIEDGNFEIGEQERLAKGVEIIKESNIHFAYIEDFSASDIQMLIEEHVAKYDTKVVVFDYIQSTPKLTRTLQDGYGHNLREDEVLAGLSRKLKFMAERYNIFIMSATQLNAKSKDDNLFNSRDSNAIRGSRAVVDKIDYGIILARPTPADLKALSKSVGKEGFGDMTPDYATFVYKNRANLDHIVLWSRNNLGNMNDQFLFATDYNYNLIDVKEIEAFVGYEEEYQEETNEEIVF